VHILSDTPTRVNTAAPSSVTVTPLVDLLRALLAKTGELVLRPMPADMAEEFLGLTVFRERSAYIAEQSDDEWLKTLVHELHHHPLGPCDREFAQAAEQLVQDSTARTLAAMGVAR
jgi:hypothetical protein